MKNLFTLIAVLSTTFLLAQTNKTDGNASNISQALVIAAESNSNSAFGSAVYFFNPKNNIEGSVHLFKNWDNYSVIHTSDKQRLVLKNINLNLERNTFESKIGKDSLFTFNFNNIEKFVINGKVFKKYNDKNIKRIFQVLYNSKDVEILKGYKIILVKGSPNPMLNRFSDKYIQKQYYYLKRNNTIKSFKFKKKNILELVGGDEQKVKKIMNLAKKE